MKTFLFSKFQFQSFKHCLTHPSMADDDSGCCGSPTVSILVAEGVGSVSGLDTGGFFVAPTKVDAGLITDPNNDGRPIGGACRLLQFLDDGRIRVVRCGARLDPTKCS